MKIYFARHGQYQNPEHVSPYRLPGFPLTELGQEQSKEIATRLSDQKIRALYTSPLERCFETATIIGKSLQLFPNQKPELIETGTPLAGISLDDPRHALPTYLYNLPEHLEGGGETPEQIFTRFSDFMEKLKLTSKNSNYLIVSHADPIMIYLYGVHTYPLPRTDSEIVDGTFRYIPMGGLVMLDYSQKGIPKYQEII